MESEDGLSPVMAQYMEIKREHEDEVLFFRLGDFYEMFNNDAVEVSRLLNLTLTHRWQAPMCGIPHHAAKIYIARLLRMGKKIVVCEQTGDSKGKALAERKVVEVITPGTAVEAEYLEGGMNNFLAALCISHGMAGFAFIDVTTSAFSATSWRASEMAESFPRELGRCSPRELLLPQSLRGNSDVGQAVSEIPGMSVSYYPDWDFNAELSFRRLSAQFKTASLKPFGLDEDSPEVPPAGFLLDYLLKTTNTQIPHVGAIRVYRDSQFLMIDDSSRRNLEIVSNLRDGGRQYTLLDCVDYARTAMGSRLVRQWLLYPLTDVEKIISRQSHVSLFFGNQILAAEVRDKLSSVLDIERLAGRIAMDRAHPKDLRALRGSLLSWLSARKALSSYDFASPDERPVLDVIELIGSSIADDPAVALTEGGIIRQGWSKELDHLRGVHDNFDAILYEYEQEERARTGISTLKIKCTNAAGYFIEVSKGKISVVPDDFILRRTLVNGDRYTTERLQELAQELSEAGARILELERDLFLEVRARLHEFVPHLMQAACEIAYTDAAASFAEAARLHDWICPSVSDGEILDISSGRHPVVEEHLPRGEFVPNDLRISAQPSEGPSFVLITGPNMAGKSTFLRQNALIVLLAQAGSFVPASAAEIGIADRIFCRVGASDNLARGESTFLVEMTETANILRSATEKSLVIMDEVGRGTSTEDGLSIAWAVSEHLLNAIRCRTLFATHYHELTRIESPKFRLLCMDVSEQDGAITFLRKVKDGATENSYGIHVARLAGVPKEVIDRANVILEHIQNLAEARPVLEVPPDFHSPQGGGGRELNAPCLFSDEEIVLDEILSSDIDSMTPLCALQAVARWKKALSGL